MKRFEKLLTSTVLALSVLSQHGLVAMGGEESRIPSAAFWFAGDDAADIERLREQLNDLIAKERAAKLALDAVPKSKKAAKRKELEKLTRTRRELSAQLRRKELDGEGGRRVKDLMKLAQVAEEKLHRFTREARSDARRAKVKKQREAVMLQSEIKDVKIAIRQLGEFILTMDAIVAQVQREYAYVSQQAAQEFLQRQADQMGCPVGELSPPTRDMIEGMVGERATEINEYVTSLTGFIDTLKAQNDALNKEQVDLEASLEGAVLRARPLVERLKEHVGVVATAAFGFYQEHNGLIKTIGGLAAGAVLASPFTGAAITTLDGMGVFLSERFVSTVAAITTMATGAGVGHLMGVHPDAAPAPAEAEEADNLEVVAAQGDDDL